MARLTVFTGNFEADCNCVDRWIGLRVVRNVPMSSLVKQSALIFFTPTTSQLATVVVVFIPGLGTIRAKHYIKKKYIFKRNRL